jgi:hypothetical protein
MAVIEEKRLVELKSYRERSVTFIIIQLHSSVSQITCLKSG